MVELFSQDLNSQFKLALQFSSEFNLQKIFQVWKYFGAVLQILLIVCKQPRGTRKQCDQMLEQKVAQVFSRKLPKK